MVMSASESSTILVLERSMPVSIFISIFISYHHIRIHIYLHVHMLIVSFRSIMALVPWCSAMIESCLMIESTSAVIQMYTTQVPAITVQLEFNHWTRLVSMPAPSRILQKNVILLKYLVHCTCIKCTLYTKVAYFPWYIWFGIWYVCHWPTDCTEPLGC